jgi:NTE family protein
LSHLGGGGFAFRFRSDLVATIVLTILAGCTAASLKNQSLDHFSRDYGYRFQNVNPDKNNSDSLFVILTFSGGGSRAAAFSYGVLEKLRDTEIVWEGKRRVLLDEVDVISSVSGGSLTSAYYGLFGKGIFEDFPERVLYKNIEGHMIRSLFSLKNQIKLVSPRYGRTDLLAEKFDQKIFEEKTFADLLARNQRPFILINSTDMSPGRRFEFTQDQFDLLYSDLGSYPVGHAVAASAAFPGLLTPLTLHNYKKGPDYQMPDWVQRQLANGDPGSREYQLAKEQSSYVEPGRPYIHLIDGGVSDNLGLLPVLRALRWTATDETFSSSLEDGTIQNMVIITVNAAHKSETAVDTKKKVPGLTKTLSVVAVGPLNEFTVLQMEYLKLYIEKESEIRRILEEIENAFPEDVIEVGSPRSRKLEVDYHFVEVSFDWVEDEKERAYLNEIPTNFNLQREEVDRLRKAAGEILDCNPHFKELLQELKQPE